MKGGVGDSSVGVRNGYNSDVADIVLKLGEDYCQHGSDSEDCCQPVCGDCYTLNPMNCTFWDFVQRSDCHIVGLGGSRLNNLGASPDMFFLILVLLNLLLLNLFLMWGIQMTLLDMKRLVSRGLLTSLAMSCVDSCSSWAGNSGD